MARVWTGLGIDNYWSTPQNWDMGGSSVPSGTDPVIFDARGTKDCTVDALAGWSGAVNLNAGYTGTVDVQCPLLLDTANGNIVVSAGHLKYSTYPALCHSLTIQGGTVTAPSDVLTVAGNWSHSFSGTFNHNNGTVRFRPDSLRTLQANLTTFNLVGFDCPASSGLTITNGTFPMGANPVITNSGFGISFSSGAVLNASGTITIMCPNGGGSFTFRQITGAVTDIVAISTATGGSNIFFNDVNIPVGLNLTCVVTGTSTIGFGPAIGLPKFGTIKYSYSSTAILDVNTNPFTCATFQVNDGVVAHTLRFLNSGSSTFSADTWLLSGSSGKQLTLSVNGAGQAALINTSGNPAIFSYLTMANIRVSGARWEADLTCIDNKGNEGWTFNPKANATPMRRTTLQSGPMVQRTPPSPSYFSMDPGPTTSDQYFAFPCRNPYYSAIGTGPAALRRYAMASPPYDEQAQTPPWTFTRRQFVFNTYPVTGSNLQVGPMALRTWARGSGGFTMEQAPTVDRRFVFPSYARQVGGVALQTGPMALRYPVQAGIADMRTRAPATNERYVFPTYPRSSSSRSTVPPAISAVQQGVLRWFDGSTIVSHTINILSDARIVSTGSFGKTSDARVLVTQALTKLSDARVIAPPNTEFIFPTYARTPAAAALLPLALRAAIRGQVKLGGAFRFTSTLTKTSDARVLVQGSAPKASDARVLKTQALTKTSDALVVLPPNTEYVFPTYPRALAARIVPPALRAAIRGQTKLGGAFRFTSTTSRLSDARVLATGVASKTSDARVLSTITMTRLSDALVVRAPNTEFVFPTFSRALRILPPALRALFRGQVRLGGVAVVIRQVTKTSDARVLATGLVSKQSDALVVRPPNTEYVFPTYARTIARRVGPPALAAMRRGQGPLGGARVTTRTLPKTSDARVLKVQSTARLSDARVLVQGMLAELSDATVRATLSLQKTSDARIVFAQTVTILKTSDARVGAAHRVGLEVELCRVVGLTVEICTLLGGRVDIIRRVDLGVEVARTVEGRVAV